MATRHSPTVRLRRLSLELRRLREQAELTLTEAARAAELPQSTLSRAETRQWRQPNLAHIARLLDVYGVSEKDQPEKRVELLKLASEGRRRGWWANYGGVSQEYSTYVGLEAEATVLRNFEPTIIPGLLQTASYARALISARAPHLPPEAIDELVSLRVERQHRLFGEDPIQIWAIICETSLRSLVGGTAVMVEQLIRLHTVAQLPYVKLQLLPFRAGAVPAQGPFAILTFADPVDPEAVYLETPGGDLWVEDAEGVARFLGSWERLISVAMPVPDTLTVIAARAKYLDAKGGRGANDDQLA
ncbi:helix-turn-helix transcriptional regulator [Actinomadura sp. KC06]|uniref:helix-turn-helix domain-containing protein n=1 Tax=Actinomadura sp. KC06 TaxID=2530369 RepID=UPI001404DE4A|nr:helix-turn-helix transcriptional regulator [Actinomadura sp. KC06]